MAAELTALQEKHNTVILQARENLQAALGDAEFQRFDEFVQKTITAKITPGKLDFSQPGSTNAPVLQQPPEQ